MRAQLARLTKSKTLLVTLVAAVLLAVVGTTVGYASLNKEVSLSVDGKASTVSTMGSTVGDVLEEEGIDVNERDVVLPGVDEKISDGTRISVKYARPLELTVDGETTTHWVTSTDVDSALAEVGRRYAGSDLSASRSSSIGRDGMTLEVATPKRLTIAFGARDKTVEKVAGLTVADVLDKLELTVDDNDIVKPGLDTELEQGDTIKVTKVRVVRKDVKGEAIPFRTVERTDASKYEDESTTVTEGRTGSRDVTYRLVFHNGRLQARKVVDQTVHRKPVDKVIEVGTKERPATTNYAPGDTVWDRLAQCESGGNWAANTGNGYYGGVQFSAATWHSVGGTGLPHQHSREEQIRRATILQQRSGWGQWPHCSAQLGLR